MFTGLIRDVGSVMRIDTARPDPRYYIRTKIDLGREGMGASISCSGCCLTLVEKGDDWFAVDVSPETLRVTSLGAWATGGSVNIEPSLRLGDEMGGHIVSGHVDGLAVLESVTQDAGSYHLKISVPSQFEKFIASKGSIAIEGISLTVNEVNKNIFGVNIIPHTWAHTNLAQFKVGDSMNFEIDMLARYVARRLEP
jgi:riboflavin synthase